MSTFMSNLSVKNKKKKKNFRFLTKAPLGKDICFTCTHLKSSYLFCLVTKKKDNRVEQNNNSDKHG